MTARRQRLGRHGETVAEDLLRRRGYRIVARNYRCPLGELDLVAEEDGVVVFVEVKTRRGSGAGTGAEAVTPRKQLRLRRLARYFLLTHGLEAVPCRFDVITLAVGGGRARVELLRNAFQEG